MKPNPNWSKAETYSGSYPCYRLRLGSTYIGVVHRRQGMWNISVRCCGMVNRITIDAKDGRDAKRAAEQFARETLDTWIAFYQEAREMI